MLVVEGGRDGRPAVRTRAATLPAVTNGCYPIRTRSRHPARVGILPHAHGMGASGLPVSSTAAMHR